jgi:endonuclease-3
MKATGKQAISKKLLTILKKRYKQKGPVPKYEGPILETIVYAICLENASSKQADIVFSRLEDEFHDWNEVRVSSISELAVIFDNLPDPETRALRLRSILQYVFEKNFEFEFEALRRKTLDLARKQLLRIKELSPFVRTFTLQAALGSHLIPTDEQMRGVAIWLGFAKPGVNAVRVSEALKSSVRKADAPLFCHLLRCLACDPLVRKTFQSDKRGAEKNGVDLSTAPARLERLYKDAEAHARKKASKKAAAKTKKPKTKPARSKPARSKAAARRKTTPKKTTRRKPAAKKTKKKSATKRKTPVAKKKKAKRKTRR